MEEAAQCNESNIQSVVYPLLKVMNRACIFISTPLGEDDNMFAKLENMRDPLGRPLVRAVPLTLACNACLSRGQGHMCEHKLWMLPQWQSRRAHRNVQTMLSESSSRQMTEMIGEAAATGSRVFPAHAVTNLEQAPWYTPEERNKTPRYVYVFVDPAGGGPKSEMAVMSVYINHCGQITVRGTGNAVAPR